MHRCFATVIEPVVAGLDPRTIVEVGAGHGRLTARVLAASTADVTIHAIDPCPAAGLLRLAESDSRVHLHAARAIEVLGRIGAADLVLLDGDPNWATVQAELKLVVARSREAGVPAPVIVVHNVHWPFGRRDGYHEQHAPGPDLRRPATEAGLEPGRSRPSEAGLPLAPFVALEEGGAHNGVLTAIDDFVIEDRGEWEFIDLPGFGGTAVLADRAQLATDVRLRAVLTALGSTAALRRAGRRAEAGRLEAEVRVGGLGDTLDELRATASRLERELASAAARAQQATTELAAYAGPGREALEAQLLAVRDERDRLHAEVRELFGYRTSHAEARRQIERLEAGLSQRERSLADAAAERDEGARLAIEARVRLEHAQSQLDAERGARDEAAAALAESRRSEDEQMRRIGELVETERLLSGRVLHLEDSVGAAHAELAEARARAAELYQRVEHARHCDRQVAELIRQSRSTRSARLGAAARRAFGRAGRGCDEQLARALALLERDGRMLAPGTRASRDVDSEADPLIAPSMHERD